jgi:hypothetical protein
MSAVSSALVPDYRSALSYPYPYPPPNLNFDPNRYVVSRSLVIGLSNSATIAGLTRTL